MVLVPEVPHKMVSRFKLPAVSFDFFQATFFLGLAKVTRDVFSASVPPSTSPGSPGWNPNLNLKEKENKSQ